MPLHAANVKISIQLTVPAVEVENGKLRPYPKNIARSFEIAVFDPAEIIRGAKFYGVPPQEFLRRSLQYVHERFDEVMEEARAKLAPPDGDAPPAPFAATLPNDFKDGIKYAFSDADPVPCPTSSPSAAAVPS